MNHISISSKSSPKHQAEDGTLAQTEASQTHSNGHASPPMLQQAVRPAGEGTHADPDPTDQNHAAQSERRVPSVCNIRPSDINTSVIDDRYFAAVKSFCSDDSDQCIRGPDPHMLASHRVKNWPLPVGLPVDLAEIYNKVRLSGIPNALGVQHILPSKLNIEQWESVFGQDDKYKELLGFVKYGFPMGYSGPTSDYDTGYNHSSANDYPLQINKFIEKERALGGIIGPMQDKPFHPWLHSAPLMSRPKRDSEERRVISDLTYPEERSVNAYIMKNSVWGEQRTHSLPTVNDFVSRLKESGKNSYMSTLDISRAYKNFRSDPLDWPLLCGHWDNAYYCDITLPFGSRASSYHMQSVANAIVDVLDSQGVTARVYLDDIITLSPNKEKAVADHQTVRDLLSRLGLPVAEEKIQPPARTVEWLGINIDSANMTISIPPHKVQETLRVVNKYRARRSMTRKDLQSLIGRLIHIAKCVSPARLFVSRLLDALRETKTKYIKISTQMKEDLEWFAEFCVGWNGIALIPPSDPDITIAVDASLTGVGASDGVHAYAAQIAPDDKIIRNISEIEAINIAIALHSFLDASYIGAHIRLLCDNAASVQVMQTGKGRNKVMIQVARYVWMLQAKFNFTISYDHIMGKDNKLADALSRAHLSPAMNRSACEQIQAQNIKLIDPCLFMLQEIQSDIFL